MTGMVPSRKTASGMPPWQARIPCSAVLGLGDPEGQTFEDAARHLSDHGRVIDNETVLHGVKSSRRAGARGPECGANALMNGCGGGPKSRGPACVYRS